MSHVKMLRTVYDAFQTGDLATVTAPMCSDIRWEEPSSVPYGSHIGPDAVVQEVFGPVLEHIDGFTVTPEEWIDGGDTVVVLGRYSGRGRSTGRELNTPMVHVWRFRDDKISGFRTHFDTHHWLEVLGEVNQPSRTNVDASVSNAVPTA